jgi:BirA family biotin operon repressor/biotin-[acetyl-CoA-carboxylase] ligase
VAPVTSDPSDPARPFAVPERLGSVDSTNRYLAELAADPARDLAEGYAVSAEVQSAGRGRLGRAWAAPAGSSILLSILFRPVLEPAEFHYVTWAVALAAAQACGELADVDARLKWPNDLLVVDRKVAGLLAEVVPTAGGRALVVGIGINVNWPVAWPPEQGDAELAEIARRATSLNRLAGRPVDRSALEGRLLELSGHRSAQASTSSGRASLATAYRARSASIGQAVRVELAGEHFTGVARDVDDAGRLLVEVGDHVRTVAAGDVVHVR